MKNLPFPLFRSDRFGDTLLVYFQHGRQLGMLLLPIEDSGKLPEHQKELKDTLACRNLAEKSGYVFPAYDFEPLTQLKLTGDAWPLQNASGTSMRNSASCCRFLFLDQRINDSTVETRFAADGGVELLHHVRFVPSAGVFEINTEFINGSKLPETLEYLASFSIGLLSPLQSADTVGLVHRFRSSWSAECRPETRTTEELGLEASWQGAGVRSLRFGQSAGIPVKNFYPFLAFEDTENHIVWGAEIVAPGPWELELSRRDDFLSLSGGLPGRESGSWCKTIAPGEHFSGPAAVVGCVHGGVEKLCTRLRAYQDERLTSLPGRNAEFPVVFNEWCTSWGNPGAAEIRPLLKALPRLRAKYFVLDSGWFTEKGVPPVIGDWQEARGRYPEGLAGVTAEIQAEGIVPGIWFEFENADPASVLFRKHPEYFLHLNGMPLRVGNWVFLNFTLPEVWHYLDEKVIAMLRRNCFGYMKVDYNAFIPFGADAPDDAVPAEMLRRQMEAVAGYFIHLRAELPELVMEICAAGGHRISPWWVRFADMVSGTDSHEGVEIPLVAAHESLLVPARALQVWAVLRSADTPDRLCYSLAAGCLGRLVLSGNPDQLAEKQLRIVDMALEFYRNAVPVLREGEVTLKRTVSGRWNRPVGWQLVLRRGTAGSLAVFHTFADAPDSLVIPVEGDVTRTFLPEGAAYRHDKGGIIITALRPFTGGTLLIDVGKTEQKNI